MTLMQMKLELILVPVTDVDRAKTFYTEKIGFHAWEADTPYFDGCLPIEVMAERGRETLRHGPMTGPPPLWYG